MFFATLHTIFCEKMKKILFLLPLLFLAACATPDQAAPNEAGEFPPDYVISAENIGKEGATTEENAPLDENGNPIATEEKDASQEKDLVCQNKNAELSLNIQSLEQKLASCEIALKEKSTAQTESNAITGITKEHLKLIRDAIVNTGQKEYPFTTCGQMGNFIRQSWYDDFSRALTAAKIRFSNGFLEAGDLFGGCQSTEGKMVFFLGAERNEDLNFHILKFKTDTRKLSPALMLDGAADAAVTDLGKREGAYIAMPADDGRIFHYYYDANVVVEAQ